MRSDPSSFEAVFAEHAPFAWRVLRRYGVPDGELEDVCQEVFLAVFKSLPSFEGRSSLKTWIYGVCRRVAANHRKRAVFRHARQQQELPLSFVPPAQPDAFDVLERKRSLATLDELLAKLAPAQREVFLLYEVDELTMREIAIALDCPLSTAFTRLYAARRGLAAELLRLRRQESVA